MNKHSLSAGLDPEQQQDLGDLSQLEAALQAYEVPESDSEILLARLQSLVSQPPASSPETISSAKAWEVWVRLAHSQLSLVESSFWWTSGFLLVLGLILTLMSEGLMAVVFALLSPVLAVAGTAYAFHLGARSLWEFELLSRVRPLQLLYARLFLILIYNAVLALTLILFAWTQSTQLIMWRLLLVWFGPMVGLTGMALYISIRWNLLAGTCLPMALWAALIGLGWQDVSLQNPGQLLLFDGIAIVVRQSNIFLSASVLVMVVGLLMIWQIGYWTSAEELP